MSINSSRIIYDIKFTSRVRVTGPKHFIKRDQPSYVKIDTSLPMGIYYTYTKTVPFHQFDKVVCLFQLNLPFSGVHPECLADIIKDIRNENTSLGNKSVGGSRPLSVRSK